MTWGRVFLEWYAAADEISRQATRTVFEQLTRVSDRSDALGVSESDSDASRAYRQAVRALAQADTLLAPLRLNDGAPRPAAALPAQPPGVAASHGHDRPTA